MKYDNNLSISILVLFTKQFSHYTKLNAHKSNTHKMFRLTFTNVNRFVVKLKLSHIQRESLNLLNFKAMRILRTTSTNKWILFASV